MMAEAARSNLYHKYPSLREEIDIFIRKENKRTKNAYRNTTEIVRDFETYCYSRGISLVDDIYPSKRLEWKRKGYDVWIKVAESLAKAAGLGSLGTAIGVIGGGAVAAGGAAVIHELFQEGDSPKEAVAKLKKKVDKKKAEKKKETKKVVVKKPTKATAVKKPTKKASGTCKQGQQPKRDRCTKRKSMDIKVKASLADIRPGDRMRFDNPAWGEWGVGTVIKIRETNIDNVLMDFEDSDDGPTKAWVTERSLRHLPGSGRKKSLPRQNQKDFAEYLQVAKQILTAAGLVFSGTMAIDWLRYEYRKGRNAREAAEEMIRQQREKSLRVRIKRLWE